MMTAATSMQKMNRGHLMWASSMSLRACVGLPVTVTKLFLLTQYLFSRYATMVGTSIKSARTEPFCMS